jgi:hypothetical protein
VVLVEIDPSVYNTEMEPASGPDKAQLPLAERESSPDKSPIDADQTGVEPSESRNFLVMAVYQITMRMGWIFKTESVVMPAVLDTIDSTGRLRGMLPLLNRLGQSVPPMLFSARLKTMPYKKRVIAICTIGMAIMMATLASLWLIDRTILPANYMAIIFLIAYALFFVATGINQLAFGTLQGKVVPTTRRGRLLTVANTFGAILACGAAWFLLRRWLTPAGGEFQWVFGFASLMFVISVVVILFADEPGDSHQPSPSGVSHRLHDAWRVFRDDRNFRWLVVVGMAFTSSLILFPHYQALARERLSMQLDNIVWWVIVQNAGTAVFSLLAGPLADRRGNRLVMRFVLVGLSTMPLVALWLARQGPTGAVWYPCVFMMVGMTPVMFKTLANYTLEISPSSEHPRYLSTLSLFLAVPVFLSPLAGWIIERTSFDALFSVVSITVLGGFLGTFFLQEPRHHIASDEGVITIPDEEGVVDPG